MKRLCLSLFLFFGLANVAFAQSPTNCLVPINAAGTPVVSAALESGHVLKGSAGCIIGGYATIDSTTVGWLLFFNSKTVPADGAVLPQDCVYVSTAPGSIGLSWAPQPPEYFSVGISIAFSSTGCFSKTASAHAYFHALVQ